MVFLPPFCRRGNEARELGVGGIPKSTPRSMVKMLKLTQNPTALLPRKKNGIKEQFQTFPVTEPPTCPPMNG